MKHIASSIAIFLTVLWSHRALADNPLFHPLPSAPQSNEEVFFKVEDGEAKIEGEVIKLIVVKPEHLSVGYKNDSDKKLYPKYTVKIYNRYGHLLGGADVSVSMFGGSSILEPGDVGGEKVRLKLVDIVGIFKHTGLRLPDDFDHAAWVALSGSNTKLADQAVAAPESKPEGNPTPKPGSDAGPR